MEITPIRGFKLGNVRGIDSGWYHHIAVIKNGKVYDRMTGLEGINLTEYKNLFDYASDLNFKIVTTSKFIK